MVNINRIFKTEIDDGRLYVYYCMLPKNTTRKEALECIFDSPIEADVRELDDHYVLEHSVMVEVDDTGRNILLYCTYTCIRSIAIRFEDHT